MTSEPETLNLFEPEIETEKPDEITVRKIIEAVLFTAGEPVNYSKLAQAAGVSEEEI